MRVGGPGAATDKDRRKELDALDEFEGETTLAQEFWLFFKIAGPTVLYQMLFMLQWAVTSTYLGTHLGSDALGGFALANLSGNLTVIAIVIGILTSVETLAPQAFGLEAFEEVGKICVRAAFVCAAVATCLVPVWRNIDVLLEALAQPKESSLLARRFLSIYVYALPGIVLLETSLRFYRAQNIVLPGVCILAVTFACHPLWLHLFVDAAWLDYGFDGAAMAHVASATLSAFLTVVVFRHAAPHHRRTFPSFLDRDFFASALTDAKGWRHLLLLAGAGVLSMNEWAFWEVVAFMGGHLGAKQLAAHSIAYSMVPLAFMVPLGISVGLTTRTGALLAHRRVAMAKRLAQYAVAAGVVSQSLLAGLLFVGRDGVIGLYTADPEVVRLAKEIWPWVMVLVVLDALQGVIGGLARALGLQFQMSVAILVSLWVLGLPAIWYVTLKMGLGLHGLWMAFSLSYVLLAVLLTLIVACKDWHAYADSIAEKFENNDSDSDNGDGDGDAARERERRKAMKAKQSDGPRSSKANSKASSMPASKTDGKKGTAGTAGTARWEHVGVGHGGSDDDDDGDDDGDVEANRTNQRQSLLVNA